MGEKVVSGTCNHEVTFCHLLEAFKGEHFALQWFLWIPKHSTVLNKFCFSNKNHQQGRQTRSNRSQISQGQACQIQRKKTYPIWCSRPPNSERDITDTQSRYTNRKSYITLNRRREFQIWRITEIDKKESFTNVEIIHASSVGLRYSLVRCFSFFISIELVTKRNRYICVSICFMFQMIDIGSLLMPISRLGLFLG